ncbi:MAG: aminotransferase class I/II-fold pyridoxal phosphate-dependent enzyme, partial [Candidatus Acidiferrales bacterium]
MRINPFDLERWQSVWENIVELNISESGVHPLSATELAGSASELEKILELPLGYPQSNGSEELRSRIAELYPGAKAENVLVTCGGSEANFIASWALVEPGDEVVFMLPNYMQIRGIAESMGAQIKPLWLRENLQWGIDVGELSRLITPKTRLVSICNPNNPAGSVLSDE